MNIFGRATHFIGQINSPNVIGSVTSQTIGADGKNWYSVYLLSGLSRSGQGLGLGVPNSQTGWVRTDQVIFK